MFFKITDAATKISKQKETMRDDQADQKVKYMQFVQMKNAPIEIKNSVDGLNSRQIQLKRESVNLKINLKKLPRMKCRKIRKQEISMRHYEIWKI